MERPTNEFYFEFEFESVCTPIDFDNEMTSEFAYLFVFEINFVDLEHPNDYEREIPQELRDLLDQEEERRARTIIEERIQ